MFELSPKKETFVKYIAEIRCLVNNRRQLLKPRWSERDLAYEHLYLAVPFVVEAPEIINGIHAEMGYFKRKYTEG